MRRGSCAYFGGARSWSATGLLGKKGFLQLYGLAKPSPFGSGAARYELFYFFKNLDEESADPMPLDEDFFEALVS